MTPCPVSWWQLKGQRENINPAPTLPGSVFVDSLVFFWELPRNWSWGEMTVVAVVREQWLVCVQARKSPAEAGKGEKLGPLYCHGTRQLEENITWRPLLPFPLVLLLFSPFSRPVLWCESGCLWEGGNTLPYPVSQGLPCGLDSSAFLAFTLTLMTLAMT